MKKGYPFLILVASALLVLAYQAESLPVREASKPLVLASGAAPAAAVLPSAFQALPPAQKTSNVSRFPASQLQPLEIEEVEAQN